MSTRADGTATDRAPIQRRDRKVRKAFRNGYRRVDLWAGQIRLLPAVLGTVIGGFGVAVLAYWLLGIIFDVNASAPATPIDVARIALTVVAGLGGVVALVIAYRRQRDIEQGRFVERFGAAAAQLGATDVAVRIAGVYAMAGVADESEGLHRQQCIDVLCGYLRLPYDATHGSSGRTKLVTTTPRHAEDGTANGETEEHVEYRQNDKEVRQTIVRVITDHLQPDVEYSWSANDFDFRTAQLQDASFRKAKFDGAARFDDARFMGDTVFEEARFTNEAGFRNTEFSGEAMFEHVRFAADAVFSKVVFSGGADFNGAEFRGPARFGRANFMSSAVFSDANFIEHALFNYGFFGSCDFDRVVFGSRARFTGVRISGPAEFSEAKFAHVAQFERAHFGSRTWFAGADFAGQASFQRAKFADDTSFERIRVSGTASFADGEFCSDVDFSRARFSGTTWFDKIKFAGQASFSDADFGEKPVSFAAPKQWGDLTPPKFDWDPDCTQKPANVEPQDWPPQPTSSP